MIPRQVAAAFRAGVRARGDEYVQSRRVRIVHADAQRVAALVRGGAEYRVEIDAKHHLITAHCSCPYAADNGICKHIWATLRLADAQRQLDPLFKMTGKNPDFVALSADGEVLASDDDLDDDSIITEQVWDDRRLPPHPRHSAPPPRPRTQSARAPEWKQIG